MFSIIIPVYNVEEYLDVCISSVCNQSYRDFEVILIDDGSTDGSGTVCDKWERLDSRIRVIHQNNGGLSVARNVGVDIALGDYIIFLDSDDYWKNENVLDFIASRLKITNADVLSFNYEKIDESKKSKVYFHTIQDMPTRLKKRDSLKYHIDRGLWIACAWNKAINRRLFSTYQLDFKVGIRSEDMDWCVRLALCAESFDYINLVGVCYRQREASISKTVTVQSVKELLDNIECCIKLLNKADDNEKKVLLRPYIAYQYGTSLVYISMISQEKEYGRFLAWADENKGILQWSQDRKIKLLRRVSKWKNMCTVINLLKFRNIVKNRGKNE